MATGLGGTAGRTKHCANVSERAASGELEVQQAQRFGQVRVVGLDLV
jgi:hypothetical protein